MLQGPGPRNFSRGTAAKAPRSRASWMPAFAVTLCAYRSRTLHLSGFAISRANSWRAGASAAERIGVSRHGPRATLSARAVFRQIAVLALVAALADGGWFVVGRLFPLIECFQRVASRKISVPGLFPPTRSSRVALERCSLSVMAGLVPAIHVVRRPA